MKIGVIGIGKVGEAVIYGLRRIGHEVIGYDIKGPSATLDETLKAELIFLCLPTPQKHDGSCDTSVIESVIASISASDYQGLVVIKSTVTPGTTDRLARLHSNLRLAMCPEFLRERARFSDFVEDHEVCVIGANSEADADLIKQAHGTLPKAFAVVTPIEAELSKYFVNVFNANRIVFANQFFDVCQSVGADYSAILKAVSHRRTSPPHYLECNDNFRAFGGNCLPKDTAAFASFAERLSFGTLFRDIVELNQAVDDMTEQRSSA